MAENRKLRVSARSIDAALLLRTIRDAGITHVLTVPDTHQQSLLTLLAASDEPRLITVCTEDEAIGINAGLYAGLARPMLLIQNNGLYACLNTLKAIPLDAGIPTLMLIGEYGRDTSLPSRDGKQDRAVRMLEPTLELWNVPYYRLEDESDLDNFGRAYTRCQADGGPVALLVGAPTGAASRDVESESGNRP